MEPEGSLSCSQVPATGVYPEPDESSSDVHFRCLYHFRIRPNPRPCLTFRNKLILYVEEFLPLGQPPRCRTTSCRLSTHAYSIYSQLPSISEAVSSVHNQRRKFYQNYSLFVSSSSSPWTSTGKSYLNPDRCSMRCIDLGLKPSCNAAFPLDFRGL